MVNLVSLALLEKYLSEKLWAANALLLLDGMVFHALWSNNAKMVKYGMYLLIVVNAQITLFGMELFVLILLHAKEDKFITWIINVFAQINIIGMGKVVHFHLVLEVRFGRELNVSAQLDLILINKDVFNALMAKFGIK